jgi:hypothetical protein
VNTKDLLARLRDAGDDDIVANVPAMVSASKGAIDGEDLHALAHLAARVLRRAPDAGAIVVIDLIRTSLWDDYAAGYVPSMAAEQREANSLARIAALGRDIVPALVDRLRKPHPDDERVLQGLATRGEALVADLAALGLRAELDAALVERVELRDRPRLPDVMFRVSERAREVQRILA